MTICLNMLQTKHTRWKWHTLVYKMHWNAKRTHSATHVQTALCPYYNMSDLFRIHNVRQLDLMMQLISDLCFSRDKFCHLGVLNYKVKCIRTLFSGLKASKATIFHDCLQTLHSNSAPSSATLPAVFKHCVYRAPSTKMTPMF